MKQMSLNSCEYAPSETGKASWKEELTHTSSFGDAIPDTVIVSPGSATSGVTFNSVTSALASETVKVAEASIRRSSARIIDFSLVLVNFLGFI
jgi:hypothetical protein